MLFKAEITKDTLQDEDLLVEQFYIFLKEFVNVKLKYEAASTKEDCIQDTIMFLLHKARQLSEEQKETINLEKYFYNRANSFISAIWLNRFNNYRNKVVLENSLERLAKYPKSFNAEVMLSKVYYENNQCENGKYYHDTIDYTILNHIINNYYIPKDLEPLVLQVVEQKLNALGVSGDRYKIGVLPSVLPESTNIIAHAIIDEYIIYVREEGVA